MVTEKNENESENENKKTPLNIIWNVMIYGALTAVAVLLIFIYGGFIFINK